MTCHHPRNPPPPYQKVLLVHYFDSGAEGFEAEAPAVSTGCLTEDGVWIWDDASFHDEELEVHAWCDLPLVPPEPPK